jgi:hypothetical protein
MSLLQSLAGNDGSAQIAKLAEERLHPTIRSMSMTMRLPTIIRRTILGAMLAAAVPHLAHGQNGRDPASQKPTDVRIRLTFDGRTMMAALYDNPSARDLATLLPLDLMIDDYGGNGKIAYLPRKLTEDGSGPFGNERPGDLCYFKP